MAVREPIVTETYIFGNISDQEVVLPDLVVGPGATGSAFKLVPGEVVDLSEFFASQRLKRTRSLRLAVEKGLLKKCVSADEKIIPKQRPVLSGVAPENEFGKLLKEVKQKDIEEEERLRNEVR